MEKSPGPDDFTDNKFYEIWIYYMTQFYNLFLQGKVKQMEMLMTLITVIAKLKNDSLLIKNDQPTSLLYRDIKLFTSILAERLNRISGKLIHKIRWSSSWDIKIKDM